MAQDFSWRLPDAHSPDVHLSSPTDAQCCNIWKLSSKEWMDALTLPQYLEESALMTMVPLARAGGMTTWILVNKYLPPDQRPILCACESFRKRSYVSNPEGELTETIIHGVASVFTDPIFRNHGYASRMMRELVVTLRSWQTERLSCSGSVLYSDIGKNFYARWGWRPFANNNHVKFLSSPTRADRRAKTVLADDLQRLCQDDEIMLRRYISRKSSGERSRMMLVPDLDHMLWHHTKEDFACDKLFGARPTIKGAIAGEAGNRIWVIWTRRYYQKPDIAPSRNTLYILRLVVEGESIEYNENHGGSGLHEQQVDCLGAVIREAQAEAEKWKLSSIHLWDPSILVLDLIESSNIPHCKVERRETSIASLLWYGEGSNEEAMPEVVANEKFAWC
jgi:GNAT superfamily N-acetyltransferase